MNAGSKLFGSMFLGLCASIGCAGLVHAQGVVSNTVTWTGTVSLVTTGNVTYAEYSWVLFGCDCEYLVSTGPVTRNGSNFWYNFDLAEETGPVICPQFIALMVTTAALGTLAPCDLHLDHNVLGRSSRDQYLHRSGKLHANAPAHRFCHQRFV